MFTGIVTDKGRIAGILKQGDWILTIDAPDTVKNLEIGASVSCSGVCLTVISMTATGFTVQVSGETLAKTTIGQWQEGRFINLERALRMGDELGGHMVSGHVDGLVQVVDRQADGDSVRFTYELPIEFSSYLAPKGSITLDGISLTVNEVDGPRFGVNIIPHTQTATTMGEAQVGDCLNFEIDLIARYVGQFLSLQRCA